MPLFSLPVCLLEWGMWWLEPCPPPGSLRMGVQPWDCVADSWTEQGLRKLGEGGIALQGCQQRKLPHTRK